MTTTTSISKFTTYKILVLGDSGVGKSALLTKFVDDKFSSTFSTTIGIDFRVKNMEDNVKLQIWDTGGQERFKTITKVYYRGSHGIILVFDVCNMDSYTRIEKWLTEVSKEIDREMSEMPIIIVGTKIDGIRVVEKKEVSDYCSKKNIPYLETSSKTGVGINEAFDSLLSLIKKTNLGGVVKATSRIKLVDEEENTNNCCAN